MHSCRDRKSWLLVTKYWNFQTRVSELNLCWTYPWLCLKVLPWVANRLHLLLCDVQLLSCIDFVDRFYTHEVFYCRTQMVSDICEQLFLRRAISVRKIFGIQTRVSDVHGILIMMCGYTPWLSELLRKSCRLCFIFHGRSLILFL